MNGPEFLTMDPSVVAVVTSRNPEVKEDVIKSLEVFKNSMTSLDTRIRTHSLS